MSVCGAVLVTLSRSYSAGLCHALSVFFSGECVVIAIVQMRRPNSVHVLPEMESFACMEDKQSSAALQNGWVCWMVSCWGINRNTGT